MTDTLETLTGHFAFPPECKLHLIAALKTRNPALSFVRLQGGHLAATDGHILALVPVDTLDGFGMGGEPVLVPSAAIKAATVGARASGHVDIANGEARAAATVARLTVTGPFPRIEAVVESARDIEATSTVVLDAHLLWTLAQALGCGKGGGVELTIGDPLQVVTVRNVNRRERLGVIMPKAVK